MKLAAFASLAFASSASAQAVLGNFSAPVGPGHTLGAGSPTISVAAGWTMSTTRSLAFARMTLDFSGGGSGQFTVYTGATAPEIPLSQLQCQGCFGSGDFILLTNQTVVMQAGQTYWLVAEPASGSTGTFTWAGTEPPTSPTGGSAASAGFLGNGQPSAIQNRMRVEYTCYPNCDGSTAEPVLNVGDLTCFLQKFAEGLSLPFSQQVNHYANCDDGPITCHHGCLNIADFSCFLTKFAAGCP